MKIKCVVKTIGLLSAICIATGFVVSGIEKAKGKVGWVEGHEPYGFYEKNVKRALDFGLGLFAFIVLSPILVVTAMLVRVTLGSPIIFKQNRPGLGEKIFTIRKFRTMHDGEASDEERLTGVGKKLRSFSVDELPELTNIIEGSMSIVGPRPQLVKDMVFMSKEHRRRHDVRAGLTGLAQVSGRNGISWEEKLDLDLKYIDKITFFEDVKIIIQTVKKVLIRDGINEKGQATGMDYGDWLLMEGRVSKKEYVKRQEEARKILETES